MGSRRRCAWSPLPSSRESTATTSMAPTSRLPIRRPRIPRPGGASGSSQQSSPASRLPRSLRYMGLRDRFREMFGVGEDSLHPDGLDELHVGDASYDNWDVVRDFDDLETARAWRQQLTDAGHEAVITSDHPINEYGRGDIALRVPPGKWSEANELLDEPG